MYDFWAASGGWRGWWGEVPEMSKNLTSRPDTILIKEDIESQRGHRKHIAPYISDLFRETNCSAVILLYCYIVIGCWLFSI